MAVVNLREAIGRAFTQEFGQAPTVERKFIATLNSPDTTTQEIIASTGIFLLSPHPEYPYLRMTSGSVTEGTPSPYHAEITYTYSLPQEEDRDLNPLARQDIWSFGTSGVAIPAYYYFDGETPKVLVNSANDFFEGAMTDESECRATIQANRAFFPLSLAVNATNCVNADAYLGAPPFHWKCGGISAQQVTEVVNDTEIRYWQITSELIFRQTGWELQLPDVGYNCIEGGGKIRAYVKDPEDQTTRIACASPMALNQDGTIRETGAPDILARRVHRAISFSSLFGTPPG
jgi:hypothetical protein